MESEQEGGRWHDERVNTNDNDGMDVSPPANC